MDISKEIKTKLADPRTSLASYGVAFFRLKHPEWTLQTIGAEVGVTRERVRQILNRLGLSTTFEGYHVGHPCPGCGVHVSTREPLYCSKQCRYASLRLLLTCDQCGKQFMRRAKVASRHLIESHSNYKGLHSFCSNLCKNLFISLHPLKYIGKKEGS